MVIKGDDHLFLYFFLILWYYYTCFLEGEMMNELLLFIENNEELNDTQRKYMKQVIVATQDMSEENREKVLSSIVQAKKDYQVKFGSFSLAITQDYEEEDRVRIASSIMNAERYDQAAQAMRLLVQTDLYLLANPAQYIESVCTFSSRIGGLYATALVDRAAFLETDVVLPLVQQLTQGNYEAVEKHLSKRIRNKG